MNAIEWMDVRAKSCGTDLITVTADEADHPEEVGTYEVETICFRGAIPYRMKKEAFRLAADFPNTAELNVKMVANMKTDVVEYFKTITRKVGA